MSTSNRLYLSLLLGLSYFVSAWAREHEVNMENNFLCNRQPFTIGERDTYTVSALPRQQGNVDMTPECKIGFAGPANLGLSIKIEELRIYDCGTMVEIYVDDYNERREPQETLDCKTVAGRTITTKSSNVAIVLTKKSSQSVNYNYKFIVTVKQPEELNGELLRVPLQPRLVEEMDRVFDGNLRLGLHKIVKRQSGGGGGMSIGVVIGIIVAGVLLILIIIGIAVFFYLQNKRNKGNSDESHIYATESSKQFPSYPKRDNDSVSSNNTSNGYRYGANVNWGYKADYVDESGSVSSSADKSSYSTNYSAAASSDRATLKSSMKSGPRSNVISNGKSSVRFSASTVNEVIEFEKAGSKSNGSRYNEGYDDDESPPSRRRSRSQSPSSSSRKKKDENVLEIWNTNPKSAAAAAKAKSGQSHGHGQRSRSRSPSGRRSHHSHRSGSGDSRRHRDGQSARDRRSRSPAGGRPRSASATSKLSQPTSISSEV